MRATGSSGCFVPRRFRRRARGLGSPAYQGRKIDPVDARSVVVVALRTAGLGQVAVDDSTWRCGGWSTVAPNSAELAARLCLDCITCCSSWCLAERRKFLSAQQSRALLDTVRPARVVGKTRRWLASEVLHELVTIEEKVKIANQELTELASTTVGRPAAALGQRRWAFVVARPRTANDLSTSGSAR